MDSKEHTMKKLLAFALLVTSTVAISAPWVKGIQYSSYATAPRNELFFLDRGSVRTVETQVPWNKYFHKVVVVIGTIRKESADGDSMDEVAIPEYDCTNKNDNDRGTIYFRSLSLQGYPEGWLPMEWADARHIFFADAVRNSLCNAYRNKK